MPCRPSRRCRSRRSAHDQRFSVSQGSQQLRRGSPAGRLSVGGRCPHCNEGAAGSGNNFSIGHLAQAPSMRTTGMLPHLRPLRHNLHQRLGTDFESSARLRSIHIPLGASGSVRPNLLLGGESAFGAGWLRANPTSGRTTVWHFVVQLKDRPKLFHIEVPFEVVQDLVLDEPCTVDTEQLPATCCNRP